eukprot:g14073.t1
MAPGVLALVVTLVSLAKLRLEVNAFALSGARGAVERGRGHGALSSRCAPGRSAPSNSFGWHRCEKNDLSQKGHHGNSSGSKRGRSRPVRETPFFEEERGGSLSRRQVLNNAAGLWAGVGLVGLVGGAPTPASSTDLGSDQQQEDGALEEYASPDGGFALRYPASFKGFSKPLKTHKVEVNFKSEEVKGYEVGVAIDPVRIESLETFGTPEEVGARVLKVEQGKDGTLDTKLFETKAEKQGDLTLYTLDYFVESTRGFKHFIAKVTIKDNLLYTCTAQAKEKDYPQVEAQLKRVVQSFRVPA